MTTWVPCETFPPSAPEGATDEAGVGRENGVRTAVEVVGNGVGDRDSAEELDELDESAFFSEGELLLELDEDDERGFRGEPEIDDDEDVVEGEEGVVGRGGEMGRSKARR